MCFKKHGYQTSHGGGGEDTNKKIIKIIPKKRKAKWLIVYSSLLGFPGEFWQWYSQKKRHWSSHLCTAHKDPSLVLVWEDHTEVGAAGLHRGRVKRHHRPALHFPKYLHGMNSAKSIGNWTRFFMKSAQITVGH